MDELDQLISRTYEESDASDPIDEQEPTPSDTAATEDLAEGDELEVSGEEPEEESNELPEDQQPDTEEEVSADPDGPEETPSEEPVAEVVTDTEKEELRRQNDLQKRLLANFVNAQQQMQQRQAQEEQVAKDNAMYKSLQERWSNMDETEAAVDQAAYVARLAEGKINELNGQLQSVQQQQAQAQYAAQEQDSREKVIPLIMQKFGLKENDRVFLEKLSNPLAMEEVAGHIKQDRQSQTTAARSAKAEKIRGNPALKAGAAPQAQGVIPSRDYESLDDLVDALYK